MKKVIIVTDSCCSFGKDKLKEMGVDFVSMNIAVDADSFDSFEPTIQDPKEFFEVLEKSQKCSTSCINQFAFQDVFEKYAKDDVDVVYIGLSGGMSATNANARIAGEIVDQKYGKHIWVTDSLSGSFGIALMIEKAVEFAEAGLSAQEIFEKVDRNGLKTFAVFAPGDLKFLKRSGRINKFVASIGSFLNLVPIILADENGELKLFSKCIGRKKAVAVLKDFVLNKIDTFSKQTIYIGHTGQIEEANSIAEFVKENTNCDVVIDYIDYTMGCNCGPKTIAVFGIENK